MIYRTLALFLLSAPLAALDPRCPQPAGLFSSSVVSGTNVVRKVDAALAAAKEGA